MVKCSDQTLDGYVFADEKHARTWLSQPFVKADLIVVERVELGEEKLCGCCGGSGYRQRIAKLGRISVADFLASPATASEETTDVSP